MRDHAAGVTYIMREDARETKKCNKSVIEMLPHLKSVKTILIKFHLIGRSLMISLKDRELHIHAAIGALV